MKRLLFSTVVLLLTLLNYGYAAQVPVEKARLVAKNMYFEQMNIKGSVNFEQIGFADEFVIKHDGLAVYYVFNIAGNNGWIAVSADDRTIPVPCFALEGNYHQENQPDNFSYWMKNYENQIAYAITSDIKQTAEANELWSMYSTVNFVSAKSTDAVSPLLGSIAWDQGCFYNARCPAASTGSCHHCPTGCVATAMAMIMKKWAYPSHGFSSHSYTHPTYGVLSANFDTTYSWSSMPNSLSTSNTQVAAIMKHCGVSVDMDYAVSGSGALVSDAADALSYYFIYNSMWVVKSSYTDAAWNALLKADLDLGRPILYGGQDTDGGHAFVCDGYQGSGNNYFHFNWGWGGSQNSYCYTSSLIPNGNAQNGNFTSNQEAVINIYPKPATMPVADFNASSVIIAPTNVINFTDQSTNSPLIWSWSVTPSGGVSYFGATTSASQNPRIKFSYSGWFTVTLTATNSAGSNTKTKTNYIEVLGTAGIDEAALASSINIYPNPSSGKVHIEAGTIDAGKLQLTLTNVLGDVINGYDNRVVDPGHIELDLSALRSGLYYLNIRTDESTVTRKIVLTK